MSHYTVGYHNNQNDHFEICEYAEDSYHAREEALEDVPDLEGHPHFIDYITKEE